MLFSEEQRLTYAILGYYPIKARCKYTLRDVWFDYSGLKHWSNLSNKFCNILLRWTISRLLMISRTVVKRGTLIIVCEQYK